MADITAQVHLIALSRRSAVLRSLHTYRIRLHINGVLFFLFLFFNLTAGLLKSNNPSLSLLPFLCVSCNILLLASPPTSSKSIGAFYWWWLTAWRNSHFFKNFHVRFFLASAFTEGYRYLFLTFRLTLKSENILIMFLSYWTVTKNYVKLYMSLLTW